MDISIIVCTFNRSGSLARTLESLSGLQGLEALSCELIVVDNNSSDDTRQVVESHRPAFSYPLVYVFERNQGLSYARNAGIQAARGGIIAFTDDDIVVDPHWAVQLHGAFQRHDCMIAGGKILPLWPHQPPDWLTSDLHGYLALLDYGDDEKYLDIPKLWGASFAVRRGCFERFGLFETNKGRTSGKLYAGEETSLQRKVLAAGGTILYNPGAVVSHAIEPERLRKSYFRKWHFDNGEMKARNFQAPIRRRVFGYPPFAIRKAVMSGMQLAISKVSWRRNTLTEELRFFYFLGYLHGFNDNFRNAESQNGSN